MKLSKSREESVISVTRRSCKHGKCSVIGIFMLKLSSGKVLIITHWRVYEDKCSKFWGHTNLSYLLCMANINGLSLAPPGPGNILTKFHRAKVHHTEERPLDRMQESYKFVSDMKEAF